MNFLELTPQVRNILKKFVKDPTERNAYYFGGYLLGARENAGLLTDHYHYLLDLIRIINDDRSVAVEILNQLENPQ